MASTVSALSSKTVWGGLIAILPAILENLPDVLAQVVPVLPPQAGAVVSAVGGIIAILGRFNPKIKPIGGIVSK